MQYCNEKKKKRSEFYPCAVNTLVFLPFFWVKGDYSFSPFINKESPSGIGMLIKRGSRFSVLLLAPQDKKANISVTPCFPCRLRK